MPLSRSIGLLLLGLALGALATWAFQSGFRWPHAPVSAERGRRSAGEGAAPRGNIKDAVHDLGTLEPAGGANLVTTPPFGPPIREIAAHEGQGGTQSPRLISH